MARSILTVISGYVVVVLAILALFTICFRDASPDTTPSMGFMLFSLGYGFLCAIVGGYITAMIAGRAEMKHAIALAVICVLMGFISMISAAGQQPLLYFTLSETALFQKSGNGV